MEKIYIEKINFRGIVKLCSILMGIEHFEIETGKLKITVPSALLMLSLLGIKNGFWIKIYDENTKNLEHVKELITNSFTCSF